MKKGWEREREREIEGEQGGEKRNGVDGKRLLKKIQLIKKVP